VGAGLLANAQYQSTDVPTDPLHSRASPLPHFFVLDHNDRMAGIKKPRF